MVEIIPGVLETEWVEIEKKINIIRTFSKIIHIDIIDGKFAPVSSFFDPSPFSNFKDISFEAHLMVEEPIRYLKPFANCGFKRFIGHVEKMSDQAEFVAEGEVLGEVGLALDSATSLDAIKVPVDDLDFVTVMTVKAGLSGQSFMQDMLGKVEDLSRVHPDIKIEVDGGINDKTIVDAFKKGAKRFVATSFLFGNQNPSEQYEVLANSLH